MKKSIYKDIFDSLQDGILVVDKNCIVVEVNDAYLRFAGYKNRNELIGTDQNQTLLKILGRESYFKQVIQTGKSMMDINDNIRLDGYPSSRYVSIFPLYCDKSSEIIGSVAIFRNLKTVMGHIEDYKKRTKWMGNNIRTIHKAEITFNDIIGEGTSITKTKNIARKAANSEMSILLLGESGTGKELFAQAIHNASPRRDQPFVIINCPSLTDSLAESELFGYEEGSFTGAMKGGKMGLCEIADQGTLFFDEIGDLNPMIQAKILRLLECGEFLRVGGTKPVKVQIRVIAATNLDISQLIETNAFRRDLYYRLCNISIDIPPLRDRKEDIVFLIARFMDKFCERNKHLDQQALLALCRYSWPGNVRELKNIIRSLSYLVEDETISLSALPERFRLLVTEGKKEHSSLLMRHQYPNTEYFPSGDNTIRCWEKRQIEEMISKYGSSFSGKKLIAKEMGISISTLYNKIRLYCPKEKM